MGDKFFDAIEKAKEDRLNFGQNLLEHFEKGKRAQIGEVRDWGGKKFRKTATGWVPAGEERSFGRGHSEISKMGAQGVKSAIMGLANIATNVKDEGDHYSIKFDENDYKNGHGKRTPSIDRIAHYLMQMTGEGHKSIEFKDRSTTLNVYKETVAPQYEPKKEDSPKEKVSLKDIARIASENGVNAQRVTVKGYVDGYFIQKKGEIVATIAREKDGSWSTKDDSGKVITGGPEVIADVIKKFGKNN